MRHRLLPIAAALMIGAGGVGAWAQSTDADGIEAVINRQMDAFAKDDFARAFTFASPSIRSLFGTVPNFAAMVRRGYPMVWRHGEVRFLGLSDIGGAVSQKVMVRGADGVEYMLEYRMIRVDGDWRIDGVRVLRQPGVAV